MKSHRLHRGRIRFRVSRTEWEVLNRKNPLIKSGEMAPHMKYSPNKRSEVVETISDQGVR